MPTVLIGCLLNARVCAEETLEEAESQGAEIGVVCAGQRGRVALDDMVAAGVIVDNIVEAAAGHGHAWRLTDAALWESDSGRLLAALGAGDDIAFCARIDTSSTVPALGVRLHGFRDVATPGGLPQT